MPAMMPGTMATTMTDTMTAMVCLTSIRSSIRNRRLSPPPPLGGVCVGVRVRARTRTPRPPRPPPASWPRWSRRSRPHHGPHPPPSRSRPPSRPRRVPRPRTQPGLAARRTPRTTTSPHRPSACRLRPVLSPSPWPPPPPLAKGRRTKVAPEAAEADVLAVFEHWRETVWKSRAVLNDARRSRLASRLAEGFTVADLKRAADGATRDDWLMGRAEGVRAGGHRDVETVYRAAAQVERLMQLAPAPRPPAPVPAPDAPPVPKLPPPLPPHLATRAAAIPVPSLADLLAHGLQAP